VNICSVTKLDLPSITGLYEQKCFAGLGYKRGDLPETERAARQTIALPIYPEISREAQRFVVEVIARFYSG
jgi:Predicted pyridoxal phosphate-dependent enzyme apparently involved in regulation of cell wall biogenesis